MPNFAKTSLFYRAGGYGVGEVIFDLLVGEDHSMSNTITTHKRENGSKITDHIKNNLRTGSLTGRVTNHSIQNPTTFLGVGTGGNLGLSNRALTAYDALKLIWLARETVTIVTLVEVYENVAITDISVSKGTPEDALEFDVSFQEITSVELKQVEIEASVNPKDMDTNLNRQAAPASKQGLQVGS